MVAALGSPTEPVQGMHVQNSASEHDSSVALWRKLHHGAWAHERAFERCVRLHVDATCTECTRRVRVDTCSAARDHDGEVCTVGMAV